MRSTDRKRACSSFVRLSCRGCQSYPALNRSSGARNAGQPLRVSLVASPCFLFACSARSAIPNAPIVPRKSSSEGYAASGDTDDDGKQGRSVSALGHGLCCLREGHAGPACKVPGEIDPVDPNPVVKCQHCEDTRQYLTSACFLAPLSAAVSTGKSARALAVVAGLIAAVKLARVESRKIASKSPRVRSAMDSIMMARMVVEASKAKQQ
jgi:hypothetical protein